MLVRKAVEKPIWTSDEIDIELSDIATNVCWFSPDSKVSYSLRKRTQKQTLFERRDNRFQKWMPHFACFHASCINYTILFCDSRREKVSLSDTLWGDLSLHTSGKSAKPRVELINFSMERQKLKLQNGDDGNSANFKNGLAGDAMKGSIELERVFGLMRVEWRKSPSRRNDLVFCISNSTRATQFNSRCSFFLSSTPWLPI